jgi:hypothetical protein
MTAGLYGRQTDTRWQLAMATACQACVAQGPAGQQGVEAASLEVKKRHTHLLPVGAGKWKDKRDLKVSVRAQQAAREGVKFRKRADDVYLAITQKAYCRSGDVSQGGPASAGFVAFAMLAG